MIAVLNQTTGAVLLAHDRRETIEILSFLKYFKGTPSSLFLFCFSFSLSDFGASRSSFIATTDSQSPDIFTGFSFDFSVEFLSLLSRFLCVPGGSQL